ncbi:MAG: right-handed parallel beta-helix repeat-containing protein [Acidimicrobiales bacterium]
MGCRGRTRVHRRRLEFYDNGVNGISGGNFNGALIARNTIYGNGADAASGQGANGGGIKLAHNLGDQPVMITDNVVYDNNMTGIWCDLQCNNVTISNNTVSDQPDHGILYEISSDGLIENNTIVNSGSDTRWGKDWSGGCITVAESERVVVTGNTLRHCDGAIVLQQTPRPQSHETWLAERYADGSVTTDRLANITVTGNEIVDSNGFGISEAPGSDGQVDYDSIVFESNTITQGIGFPTTPCSGQRASAPLLPDGPSTSTHATIVLQVIDVSTSLCR